MADKDTAKPRPADNSHEQKDGGWLFTAWDIHIASKTLKEAKQIVKDAYGIDVDEDPAPPPPQEPVQEPSPEE